MSNSTRDSELASRIEARLLRRGLGGHIEIENANVRLVTRARQQVSVTLPELTEWSTAAPERREQIVDNSVRELLRVRALSNSTRSHSSALEWLRPIGAIAFIGAGCWGAWHWLGRPAHEAMRSGRPSVHTPSPVAVGAPPGVGEITAAERCERVQARIATGGSLSPLDVDGWVVELALLSSSPALDPEAPVLDKFLSKPDAGASQARRLTWSLDDGLRSIAADAESVAVVTGEPLAGVVTATKSGVRITWSGKYVVKYFDETTRAQLHRLASALYDATGADYGALYARCVATSIHQAGSWFRGSDLGGAMLAVVAAMGMHAPVVHLAGAISDARTDPRQIEIQRNLWRKLNERTHALGKESLTFELAEDGAAVAARPGKWVGLTFPFQDANRATRASLRLTQKLGLAPRY